ncbi:MAG TPA: hypothetical protein ENH70_08750 [Desulfobacteraceae bacterium]|nr:hypothetical protein [Desulfobacteraceae bacterium]
MKTVKQEVFSARLSHACRFSLDCKMFGAYCYLSEIKGTIPLLHGPLGCAFFPKLVPPDAIRTQLLDMNYPPPFPCTDLKEKDVIYGGAEKLRNAILAVDKYYRPELIGVIVSCPAAIIGDDILEIVNSVRDKIDADIIYTPSSAGFSDDERVEDFNRHAEDLINIWKDPDRRPKWGIEKCGRLDTLYSLIEQLVESPKDKIDNSVNIDTYGRFHWFEDLSGELREIKRILKEIGIRVNTVFPGCSVQDIKCMARARLNFMRRSERSARFMKDRFGIDYLFDIFGTRYLGIRGVRRFYLDIADKFGLKKHAEKVVRNEEARLEKRLKEVKKEIKAKRIAYVCTPLYTTPESIKLVEMFGLDIKMLSISTMWWRRWGMSKSNAQRLVSELKDNLKGLQSAPEIYTDLSMEEEVERIRENDIDLAIGDVLVSEISRTMYYENHGIRSLSPHSMGYSSFRISFSQIAYLATMIASRLNSPVCSRDLLYLHYQYHPERFPTLVTDLSDELKWEKVMKKVWRDRSGR